MKMWDACKCIPEGQRYHAALNEMNHGSASHFARNDCEVCQGRGIFYFDVPDMLDCWWAT